MAHLNHSRWSAHIVAALGGTAAGQILAGIAQILIVRMLGVAGYGTYALLYAWLAIASSILGAGLDTWLLDAQSRQTVPFSMAIRRIVAIKAGVWSVCLLGAVIWLTAIPTMLLVSGLVVILVDTLVSTGYQVLRGQNRHPRVAILQIIGPVVVLCAVLLGATPSVQTLVWVQLVGALITLGAVAVSLNPMTYAGVPVANRLLSGAFPFVISDICAQLYTQSTTIIVGSQMAHSAVGIYRGAWSLVGYSFVVPAVLFQTTLPHLNAEHRPSARRAILLRSGGLFLLYAVVTGILIIYAAPVLLPVLYGPAFSASANLLPAFAWIPFYKAMSFYAVLILLMQRQITRRIFVQLLVVTVVWGTAPWLIRTHGITGAVTAQLISEAVLGIGYMVVAASSLRLTDPIQSPPAQVVVTNLHGLANLGDAAIHQVQVAMLTQGVPTAHLTLFSVTTTALQHRFPQATVLRGVHSWVYDESGHIATLRTRVHKTLLFGCLLLLGRWVPIPRWAVSRAEYETLRALQSADAVYMSGGGYLYDGPTATPLRRFLLWDWWILADVLLAIAWQRPVFLLPQSIGPCSSWLFAWLMKWTLARAQSITVRDTPSAELLTTWGITHLHAPDLAWGLPITALNNTNNPPILGISVLDWGAQYPAFQEQARYEDALVETIQHYQARGWRIQLFSQCREEHHAWDDRIVSARIGQRIGDSVEVMADFSTPETLAAAYAGVDCFVATRMHAAILRMRSGGTCVMIGYLPKAAGLMADMGLSDWHIPIADVNAERLMSAIETRTQQQPLLRSALERIDEQRLAWRAAFAQSSITEAR